MLVLLYLTHYVKMCRRCSILPSHSLLESAHSFSSVSISVYKSFKLSFLTHSLAFLLAKTRSCRYNKEKTTCAECTSRRSRQTMKEKRWESCNAEALLEEFFSQDDLRQLALSTGELLGCPLRVLDDTFHVVAHHLPLGFSDALFETAVRCGEISYEAGAIISKNAMLTAGWADYVRLADSPYRRRFAPLISAGVRLGCLICVDTDIWKRSRRRPGAGGAHPLQAAVHEGEPSGQAL